MTDPARRLQELLGAAPPPAVAALPADRLDALADLVANARRAQAEGLSAAFEATLKHVPFPVRAIVKRVLL